jgi:2-polyprenyl-3-methyl-5-hydroxy-6-metoxy-1,4-benzoquinol methylase
VALVIDPDGRELEALARVVDFTGLRVLDVGCGDGRLTGRIAPKAESVLGIDADAELIRTARRETPPDLRDRVEFRKASIVDLDEPPRRFDLVFFTWSL